MKDENPCVSKVKRLGELTWEGGRWGWVGLQGSSNPNHSVMSRWEGQAAISVSNEATAGPRWCLGAQRGRWVLENLWVTV